MTPGQQPAGQSQTDPLQLGQQLSGQSLGGRQPSGQPLPSRPPTAPLPLDQSSGAPSSDALPTVQPLAAQDPIAIESLRVRPGRIELTVKVASQRYANTTPQLIERCLQHAPTLGMHACRNGVGPTFGAVMNSTSVPHLLEHLMVDAQTRAAQSPQRVFAGTTQWSAESPLVANIAVSYEDDLAALRALKESMAFLNGALRELLG